MCLPHGLHVSSKTTPRREPRCQLFFTQSDRSVHFQKSLSQEYNRSLGPYSWATVPIHSSTAPRSLYHVHLFVCTLSVIKSQSVHTTITVQPIHCIKAAATVWWQSGSCIFSTRNTNKTLISARPKALLICLQTMRVQLMIPFISLTSLFSHKYVKLCKMYVHLHVCSSCRSLLLCP